MIVFGKKCFEYVLRHSPSKINEIYLSKEIDRKLFARLKSLDLLIKRIDNKKAQSLSGGGNHQGMLLDMQDIAFASLKDLLHCDRLIVLCDVSDIGNIGSIARSGYALGAQGLILSDRKDMSKSAMSAIFRVSSGALLHMPFAIYDSSLDLINILKTRGFSLFGADSRGEETPRYIPNRWALFMGREDIGLTNRILDKMDGVLGIKMSSGFDSLNVSVAAGILIDRINNMQKRQK